MSPRDERSRWPALATAGVHALSVLLPLVELLRIAVFESAGHFWTALAATAVALPLHLRHVAYALGRREAPGGPWTLAVVWIAMLVPVFAVGSAWAFMLASLVVSTAIVLRPRWSLPLGVAVVAGAFVLGTLEGSERVGLDGQGSYFAISVAFRSAVLLVAIWLVAAIRELHAAREALAEQAVRRQRADAERDLERTLTRGLEDLSVAAGAAERLVAERDPRAGPALAALAAASRARLADTRRIVAGHRGAADRRRLEAVARLLRADLEPTGPTAASGPTAPTAPPPTSDPPPTPHAGPASGRTAEGGDAAAPATPVHDAVAAVRRSRLLLVLAHVPPVAFVFLISTTGLSAYPSGEPWLGLVVLAMAALLLRLSLATAAGVRPTHAVASALAIAALAAVGQVAIGNQWITAFWFVGAAAAMAFTGPLRVVLVAATVVGQIVPNVLEFAQVPAVTGAQVAWYCVYIVVLSPMGGGAMFGAARLARVAGALDRTQAALAERAVDGERRRFSRDLHDALGQSLSAIALKADLAAALLPTDPSAATREAVGIREVAERLADDARAVVADARPVSFVVEAAGAVELLRAAGVHAEVDVDLGPLTTEADALFGWAVREGATNVLRHSTARRCRITAVRDDGRFGLELVNDGADAADADDGSGLAGLADRAGLLRGVVSAERADGGFRLRVLLPEEAS